MLATDLILLASRGISDINAITINTATRKITTAFKNFNRKFTSLSVNPSMSDLFCCRPKSFFILLIFILESIMTKQI